LVTITSLENFATLGTLQHPVTLSFRQASGPRCPIQFELGVGEAFEGPFAESFEPSDETEELLVQASQLLEGLEASATRSANAAVSGTIDDLLLGFPAVGSSFIIRITCF